MGDKDWEGLAEMAAFGASDTACYRYPGAEQQAERAAYCEGAAWAATRIHALEEALRPFSCQRPHKNEDGAHGILVPATVADVRQARNVLGEKA